jgi:alkanesulfonate monooxygenase SsuD/methylene tetrahydromethanopterin reductase-like flavin-dependent oxidoreductase (luciferase family)
MIRCGHLLGVHPSSHDNYFDTVLAVAQASEAAGMDAVFYSDHFQYQRHSLLVRALRLLASRLHAWGLGRSLAQKLEHTAHQRVKRYDGDPRRTLPVLECFTTLAAIAAATRRIRVGALVAGIPYRNPALLAKSSITLDVISHGRCIVGLGAGWHAEEFRSYGWPFPPLAERMNRLEEAVCIVDAMLRQPRASFHGRYYQIDDALSHPRPVQRPRPPLLIGGSGERRTLRLVARYADYSNLFGSPDLVAHKVQVLQEHCIAIGRPLEQIICSNFVGVLIGATEREVVQKRRHFPLWLGYPITGTPEQVFKALQAYVDMGVRYIICNFPDAHTLEPIHLFAETVMPALAVLSVSKNRTGLS